MRPSSLASQAPVVSPADHLPGIRRLGRGMSLARLALQNPPGTRQLSVGISSNHLFILFFAAVVWLMAAVIGQGQALAEENEHFV